MLFRSGIAFGHAMTAFRWVRNHYDAIRVASGAVLVALGLLLFFNRNWWLNVGVQRVLDAIGLDAGPSPRGQVLHRRNSALTSPRFVPSSLSGGRSFTLLMHRPPRLARRMLQCKT